MSSTYNIIFNNTTATLIIDTALSNDNNINWRLVLTFGMNTIGTFGRTQIELPVAHTITEPVASSIADPVAHTITESVASSIADPVAHTVTDPVAHTITEPVASSIAEPVASSITDPVTHTIIEPVASSIAEPVASSIAKPVASSIAEPVASSIAEPVASSISEPVASSIDKKTIIKTISYMLTSIETSTTLQNKIDTLLILLDYIIDDALEFTKNHKLFKNTVIDKCYEFKQINSNIPSLVEKADIVLNKLDASTTIPDGFLPQTRCLVCGDNHNNPATSATSSHIALIPASIPTPITDATVAHVIEPTIGTAPIPYDPEAALFLSIARKQNATKIINDFTHYFTSYKILSKYDDTGTQAEKMNRLITSWSIADTTKRAELMKTLFAKNKLVFSDVVMPLYNEWVTTEYTSNKLQPWNSKPNRYKKMCAFINAHKSLFTV